LQINPHFGGATGLTQLSQELHARNMYLMVDVVGNHMGVPQDYNYSTVVPFNNPSYYHSCKYCPHDDPDQQCWIEDFSNQTQVELCQLDGLPDLDQSNPFVANTLVSWVKQLIANFSIDGLRVDTVAEVHPDFWTSFQQAAGIYAVGEVFNGDVNYVSPYQHVLTSLLNYPLYFPISTSFMQRQSMFALSQQLKANNAAFKDVTVLGVFADNHDNPRSLSIRNDQILYKAELTFTLMTQGIPIIYYGTEQGALCASLLYCLCECVTLTYHTMCSAMWLQHTLVPTRLTIDCHCGCLASRPIPHCTHSFRRYRLFRAMMSSRVA